MAGGLACIAFSSMILTILLIGRLERGYAKVNSKLNALIDHGKKDGSMLILP